MATFNRFEDLPVWQEAIKLADEVYNMTESREWKGITPKQIFCLHRYSRKYFLSSVKNKCTLL